MPQRWSEQGLVNASVPGKQNPTTSPRLIDANKGPHINQIPNLAERCSARFYSRWREQRAMPAMYARRVPAMCCTVDAPPGRPPCPSKPPTFFTSSALFLETTQTRFVCENLRCCASAPTLCGLHAPCRARSHRETNSVTPPAGSCRRSPVPPLSCGTSGYVFAAVCLKLGEAYMVFPLCRELLKSWADS